MRRICYAAKLLVFAIFGNLTLAHSGHTADISRSTDPGCSIDLNGGIERGDLVKLKSFNLGYDQTLCLHSPGGNFVEGLEIAEYLSKLGAYTVLKPYKSCFSACAIIFMGGSEWEEGIFLARRRMSIRATLGFHAPYILPFKTLDPIAIKIAYTAGLNAVSRMMALGSSLKGEGAIPNYIIQELLGKGPDDVYLVDTAVKAKELQIELTDVPLPIWDVTQACNACIHENDGQVGKEICTTVQTVKTNTMIEHSFYGVGGESSYWCVFRATITKTGISKPMIAGTTELPPNPKEFSPVTAKATTLGDQPRFGQQ